MSVAGFRPGLGRGGITHSLEVTEPGVAGPGEGAADGVLEAKEGAGARANAVGAAATGASVMDKPVVAMTRLMPYVRDRCWVMVSMDGLGWVVGESGGRTMRSVTFGNRSEAGKRGSRTESSRGSNYPRKPLQILLNRSIAL